MTVPVLMLALATLYAFTTWASIKIIDRYNTRNTMGAAIACGVVFGTIIPFAGMLFAMIPLVGLMFVFVIYYDLGFIRAVVTIIVMGIMLHVLGTILVDTLGQLDDSTAGIWGGVFVAGIIGAYVLRKKGIVGGTPEQQYERLDNKQREQRMPKAKATIRAKAAKQAKATPSPEREVAAAPEARPPAADEPAAEVPPQPEPSSLDDRPTFLR